MNLAYQQKEADQQEQAAVCHERFYKRVILFPRRFCETRAGNLAHAIGRIVFKPGQPMLVEHIGGIYLEHDLTGRVITPGYGDDYQITHVYAESES